MLLSLLVIFGCAETRVTSIKSILHGEYSNVLLMASFDDLQLQNDYESALHNAFLSRGVASIRGIDVFPPLRTYSDSEVNAGIKELNVDAILVLTPNGTTTGSSTSYSALTGHYNTNQTVTGIYSEISLKDVKSGQQVYRASISTSLDELSSSSDAVNSAASKLCDDLWKNNFLTSSIKPKRHSPNPYDNN